MNQQTRFKKKKEEKWEKSQDIARNSNLLTNFMLCIYKKIQVILTSFTRLSYDSECLQMCTTLTNIHIC